jgi:Ca2+-transporting ATPase
MRNGSIFTNLYLLGAFIVCASLQLSVILIPDLRGIFKTVPLDSLGWWIVGLLSASSLLVGRIYKLMRK